MSHFSEKTVSLLELGIGSFSQRSEFDGSLFWGVQEWVKGEGGSHEVPRNSDLLNRQGKSDCQGWSATLWPHASFPRVAAACTPFSTPDQHQALSQTSF